MALVAVTEKWSQTNADISAGEGVAHGVIHTTSAGSRGFNVLYDAGVSAVVARDAAGLPAINAAHPDNAALYAISRRATRLSPILFEVVVEYANADSPLLAPYERNWESAESIEPIDRDINDVLLLNAAGDPVTGITRRYNDPVYVVSRNEAADPKTIIQTYSDTINTLAFQGYAAGKCLMLPITSQRQVVGGTYYWRTTYRIQCREDGWQVRYANKGPRYLPTVGAAPVPFADLDGRQEGLLAANGTALPDGSAGNFLTADVTPTSNFTALALE